MIIRALGSDVELRELATRCDVGRHGLAASSAVAAARQMGFTANAYASTLEDLTALSLPLMLHWDFNHWVVLVKIKRASIIIIDPSIGYRTLSFDEFANRFTGIVLQIGGGITNPRAKSVRKTGRLLGAGFIDREIIGAVLGLLLSSIAVQCFGVVVALAIGKVVGSLVLYQTLRFPASLITLVACFAAAKAALSYVRNCLINLIRLRADTHVIPRLLRHVLRLPLSFFDYHPTAELLSRIDGYAQLRQLITTASLGSLLDIWMLIGYAVSLYWICKTLIIPTCLLITAQVIVSAFQTRRRRDALPNELECESLQRQSLLEAIQGIRQVKASGCEEDLHGRWSIQYRRYLQTLTSNGYVDSLWDGVLDGIATTAPLFIVAFALWSAQGRMNAAGTVAGIVIVSNMLGPITGIVKTAQQMINTSVYFKRLSHIMNEPPEAEPVDLGEPIRDIGVTDLSYRYPGELLPAVDNFSCAFREGTLNVIVGPTACGKSTLLAILVGLIDPQTGSVVVNNRRLTDSERVGLRRRVGYVVQEEAMFAGTIRSNIIMGRDVAPHEILEDACRLAHIYDEIMSMPAGF